MTTGAFAVGFFVRGPYHGEKMPFLHHVMIVWFPAPILSERGVSRRLTCPVSNPGTDPTWSRCVLLAACAAGGVLALCWRPWPPRSRGALGPGCPFAPRLRPALVSGSCWPGRKRVLPLQLFGRPRGLVFLRPWVEFPSEPVGSTACLFFFFNVTVSVLNHLGVTEKSQGLCTGLL